MNPKNEISNTEDVIDSRDIEERINWLIENRDEFQAENTLLDYPGFESGDESKWAEWDSEYGQELRNLETLRDDCDTSEWKDGVQLIRDTYFEDYAQELAEDIGAINRNSTWPNNCIDWEEAASQLQQDYSSVQFDGVDYWFR
jgi:hypothetical protein